MPHIRLLAGDLSSVAGSSTYCEELALRLAERGHRVSVVCLSATPRLRERCEVTEVGRSPRRAGRFIWRWALYLDEGHCKRALRRAGLPRADVSVGLEHLFLRGHGELYPHTPLVYVPLSLVAPAELASYQLTPLTK